MRDHLWKEFADETESFEESLSSSLLSKRHAMSNRLFPFKISNMKREYVMSIYSDRRKRILEMKQFSENKLKQEQRYKFWDSFVLNRYYFDFFLMSLPVAFTVMLGYKLDGHDLQWWIVFLPLAIFELWMLFSVISTCILLVKSPRFELTYSKYSHKGSTVY